ncbi:MAG: response regulator [Chthoniobacteraceae bacterium]
MPKSVISKAKILIVDDEPSNVRLLERILELYGVGDVRSTTDSRKALSTLFEFEPDLVLLDLNMPFLDGFAVMAQIKEAIPAESYLPIVVLTADVTAETKRRALAAGAHDFLTKPLDNSEVVLRIKNLLENRFLNLEMQNRVKERTAQLEETLEQLGSTQQQIVKQERLRALGMMAGGIAHDFNNALTMMLGYAELLLPWLQQHASTRELAYLNHIIDAAQDAAHVVSRLREFYRPAENNEIRVPVNLSEMAQAAISLTAPKWKGKSRADGVQIEVFTELADVPPIAGNAAEIREVLTNLIFNAVDAMPEGGSITVRTTWDEKGVVVSVSDTGFGMTEAEIGRCLEPFFTTKGDRGTGLGLAVVYGIVQRHEGTIDITSEKGVGTTFAIRLPSTAIQQLAPPKVAQRVAQRLRILVVDDQEIICELIAEYLKGDGHHAVTAVEGTEALAVFEREGFDLVITDHSMPGMNGVQLAKAMKDREPSTRVILLTGFGDEMMGRGERPPEIDLVLGKPVSAADLRDGVYRVLADTSAVSVA